MQKFQAFVLAAERLSNQAKVSTLFNGREKAVACTLYLKALESPCLNEGCQSSFDAAYRVLGAPGDFGYHSPEGEALKGLYDAWNKALAEAKEAGALKPKPAPAKRRFECDESLGIVFDNGRPMTCAEIVERLSKSDLAQSLIEAEVADAPFRAPK